MDDFCKCRCCGKVFGTLSVKEFQSIYETSRCRKCYKARLEDWEIDYRDSPDGREISRGHE